MQPSTPGKWRRNPKVLVCLALGCLVTLSSCSLVHPGNVATKESVPQKSASAGLPPGVHIVDAAAVEQESQRMVATLGRGGHESIVASDEGYYLDVLQGRLQQAVGGRVDIRRDGQTISLEILGRMTTDTSGARLDPVTEDILTQFGRVLVEYHATVVTVQVLAASATDAEPSSAAPIVVRRLVQEGAASMHLLLVAPGPARADKPKSASSTDIRIAFKIQPIPRTQRQ